MPHHDYPPGGYWPSAPLPAQPGIRSRRLLLLCMAAVAVFVLAFVLDNDDPRQPGLSPRSWLMLALSAVLLVLLSLHHRYGARQLVRTLAEYALVALLAVLVTLTALPAANQPPSKPAAGRKATAAAKAAGDACPPAWQVPAWLACWWQQANQWREANSPAKPKHGHALSHSPIPSTRRTL
jgi:hypothetical protein